MHKKFDSGEIEKKWQNLWKERGIYNVGARDLTKPKSYVLVEWPYPSGNLHIGHWYAFAVPDIYARYKRMTGHQTLYPMGFDAFGLPAENAAIKRNLDPKDWTYSNMAFMREQLERMGNMFSWDMTTNSTDQDYYKWTQWMFTQFFERGIAYRGKGIVNWCPGCNTAVANEQVLADGTCERSGDVIEKREMPQWMMKITDYADRLIDDLDTLDWPEHIKESQRQWIGRSKGAKLTFNLSVNRKVEVFTTRPDTLFGATYLVIAPEHPLLNDSEVRGETSNLVDVDAYIKTATQKAEQDRLDATKEKTGVKLEGITATNPASGESIPVYVADYVLGGYGTGAIMAVPAHDERDHAFATKFGLPIKQVVATHFIKRDDITRTRIGVYGLIEQAGKYLIQHFTKDDFYWLPGGGLDQGETFEEGLVRELNEETPYTDFKINSPLTVGIIDTQSSHSGDSIRNITNVFSVEIASTNESPTALTESEVLDGIEMHWLSKSEILKLQSKFEPERVHLIIEAIEKYEGMIKTSAGTLVNSGEFDGMDSEEAKEKIVAKVGGEMTSTYRLRDWSIGRQRYWGVPIPIVYSPEGVAHIVPKEHLPWVLPADVDFKPTGIAPLAKSEALKKRTEEIFGTGWTPEVETMDTFVDSSWYFLRYFDNQNNESLSSLEKQKEWMPIDMYFGGAEHTTMHLLYSRFWQKALFDLGLVADNEPYKRRINHGMILGPDGNKMSKSKGNVVDPDEQVARVGADTVKMYLAFMGPYADSSYPWDMGGLAGVRRFLERVYGLTEHIIESEPETVTRQLHKTITKVGTDISEFKFNTAISAMMILVNQCEKEGIRRESYEAFVKMLAPFAPHITEQIWSELGNSESIHLQTFPIADPALAIDLSVIIGVQINGKLRGQIEVAPDATETEVINAVQDNPQLQEKLLTGTLAKVIYVPGRILNLIVK
ncbi:class I tRNA ligase family protein [Patescibacteria group bacterium]|nr:class I tRNA ligase family protein [Patescibacteria group bacterium]